MNENAGPEYLFYYKAAITKLSMLVILIMGSCMPAFYLLGIIALACQYIVDRLMLSYFYRIPPMYSEILTLETIDLMKYVTPINLIMLFW